MTPEQADQEVTLPISVFGAGYVGLVTAACLSKLGHSVRCIDIDLERTAQLSRGRLPFAEPGLGELVQAGLASGTLTFHSAVGAARETQFAIVAVGTLDDAGRWTANSVRQAALEIAADGELPRRIVIRSTLMPGTSGDILAAARAIDARVEIAHNPEFTREGLAVADFLSPDRVVVGVEGADPRSETARLLIDLYEPLGAPVVLTDLTSAETIKIGSNVFLATKIAFANELARFCAAAGADVYAVIDALGRDPRIGRAFLSPGPGFGGACLPSQSRELPLVADRLGVQAPLLRAIAESNAEAVEWVVRQVTEHLGGSLKGRTVGVLGITFKAGTDDLRESPALLVASRLATEGASLRLYDPTGAHRALPWLGAAGHDAAALATPQECATGADAVVVVTEWPEFRLLDWSTVADRMRGRLLFDARGVVDMAAALTAGLHVVGLGRRYNAGQLSAGR